MTKEFVPYQEALELKELGFDEPCFTWYWDDIGLYNGLQLGNHNKSLVYVSAPLYQQAFKWFREKHMIKGYISHSSSMGGYKVSIYKWNNDNNVGKWERLSPLGTFVSYEEAEISCLKKLIEIVKYENKKST
jgi:hypothetical protein